MLFRSFVYESEAEIALKEIEGIDRKRADEMIRAIEWLLTRSPEEGTLIDGFLPKTFIYKTDTKHEGIETITLIYQLSGESIKILNIRYLPRNKF